MKGLTGWAAAAALVLAVPVADAQVVGDGIRAPYRTVSDLEGPYYAPPQPDYAPPQLPDYAPPDYAPPQPPAPRYGYGYRYGYEYDRGAYDHGAALLPAEEVYAVLRENGFSPLGIPRLRGVVYTIAVVDRRGDDGRLLIDARDGRILRFIPAYGIGPGFDEGAMMPYYGAHAALPPPTAVRATPRPPAPIPHVASRTVPMPRSAPPRGEPPATAARPPDQAPQPSATAQAKAPETGSVPQAAVPTLGQARSAPTIRPTEPMPPVQGLE